MKLDKEELKAIKSLQTAIKEKEVLILSQDKGRAIVLEDPGTYKDKMHKILDPPDQQGTKT